MMSTETEQVEAPVRITLRPRADGTDYFPIYAPMTEYVRADVVDALRERVAIEVERLLREGRAPDEDHWRAAYRVADAALYPRGEES